MLLPSLESYMKNKEDISFLHRTEYKVSHFYSKNVQISGNTFYKNIITCCGGI